MEQGRMRISKKKKKVSARTREDRSSLLIDLYISYTFIYLFNRNNSSFTDSYKYNFTNYPVFFLQWDVISKRLQ